MKKFNVNVDITMSKTFEVEAENEENAIAIVNDKIDKNPYGYANGFSHYVTHEVVDAEEIEEE